MDDIITLLKATKTQNAYGVWVESLAGRDVFARIASVSASEFFEGGRNGLKPSFKITLFFGDYEGEGMLTYKGKTYTVYRTYKTQNDTLELYVEEKGGSNGKQGQALTT